METAPLSRTLLLFALGLFLAAAAVAYLPVTAPGYDVDDCGSLLRPEHDRLRPDAEPDERGLVETCRGALRTRTWLAAAAVVPGLAAAGASAAVRRSAQEG